MSFILDNLLFKFWRFLVVVQDFHKSDGNKLLSAGMDHKIKIWDLSGVDDALFECCLLAYGNDACIAQSRSQDEC